MAERRKKGEGGFTFIELVIALAILASAITVFVGLQSAAIQRSIHDRNMQQAMLGVRRIMAEIDADRTKIDQGSIPATQLLSLLALLGSAPVQDPDELSTLAPFQGSVLVEEWPLPIPGSAPNDIRKVTVTVGWGPDPDQQFSALYFIPS